MKGAVHLEGRQYEWNNVSKKGVVMWKCMVQ